jgi:putative ABC transport system permease protein
MRTTEGLRMAWNSLSAHRLRSGLTALGMIIGVAAVIVLVAIGQGSRKSVTGRIDRLGTNLLNVTSANVAGVGGLVRAGIGGQLTLTTADWRALSQLPRKLVRRVVPVVSARMQIVAGAQNSNAPVIGTVPGYLRARGFQLALGNFLTFRELQGGALDTVLGAVTAQNLFGPFDPVGRRVFLRGVPFRVVGVLRPTGGLALQDIQVYVPISAYFDFLGSPIGASGHYLGSILVQAASSRVAAAAQGAVETTLLRTHHLDSPSQADFNIFNQTQLLQTLGAVSRTLTLLLGSVAAISLVVGGIGIMNIMLVSVSERIPEIGVRLALGAKPRDIRLQFLAEATFLATIGGLLGVLLGTLGAPAAGGLLHLQATVTPGPPALAFLFSAAVGLGFGFWPAQLASQQDPLEALRRE